ncbi:hypothetical protein RUND412_009995 [Rhizina undulata]
MPELPRRSRRVSRDFGDRSYHAQPNPNSILPDYISATSMDPNPSAGKRVRFELPSANFLASSTIATSRPSANRAELQLRSAETMETSPAPLPPRPFSFFEERWLFICIARNFPLRCTPKDWVTVADKFKENFEPRSALSLEAKWKELMTRGVTINFFAEPFIDSQLASAPVATVTPPAPSNPVATGSGRHHTLMQEKWLREWAVDKIDGKRGTAADWRICARDFHRRFSQERSISGLSLKWKQMWEAYGEIEGTPEPVMYGTAEEDGEDMGEVIVVRNRMARRG